jgi:hypothetical protein
LILTVLLTCGKLFVLTKFAVELLYFCYDFVAFITPLIILYLDIFSF